MEVARTACLYAACAGLLCKCGLGTHVVPQVQHHHVPKRVHCLLAEAWRNASVGMDALVLCLLLGACMQSGWAL
jgi:hypothetical protein